MSRVSRYIYSVQARRKQEPYRMLLPIATQKPETKKINARTYKYIIMLLFGRRVCVCVFSFSCFLFFVGTICLPETRRHRQQQAAWCFCLLVHRSQLLLLLLEALAFTWLLGGCTHAHSEGIGAFFKSWPMSWGSECKVLPAVSATIYMCVDAVLRSMPLCTLEHYFFRPPTSPFDGTTTVVRIQV